MSNIDNLINKIESDSSEKSKEILDVAKDEASKILKDSEVKLKTKTDAIINKANADYETIKEKQIAAADLKARDMVLKSKEQVVDKILQMVLNKLNELPEEKYMAYLKKSLSKTNLSPDAEIRIPEKYLEAVRKSDLGIKISDKFVDSGFSILDGNIFYNNEFDNLVEARRGDLEIEIFEKLFLEEK